MRNLPTDPPITSEPRRLRPPYDVPDPAFDHLRGDTETWQTAVRLDRLAALREPLDGLTVTDYEVRYLRWLAEVGDTPTMAVIAALLRRARAAERQS
jgi:hypothetical protein